MNIQKDSFLSILFFKAITLLTVLLNMLLSVSARAQTVYKLDPNSIESALSQTLRNQRIVFFAETHKSQNSFELVGPYFLNVLKQSGFNCLLLETSKAQFQSAYINFENGASYSETIGTQKTKIFKQFGINLSEDSVEKEFLETARKLKFQIFPIDQDVKTEDLNLFYNIQNTSHQKKYLEIEMGRNVFMASEIARKINSGVCQRAIVVVGATHINPEALSTYSDRILKSIPEILELAGWDSVSYRLRSHNSAPEKNIQVYDGIFVD